MQVSYSHEVDLIDKIELINQIHLKTQTVIAGITGMTVCAAPPVTNPIAVY